MFWDRAAALAFLGAHYPWFLSTFLSYPKVVLQGVAPMAASPFAMLAPTQAARHACSPLLVVMPAHGSWRLAEARPLFAAWLGHAPCSASRAVSVPCRTGRLRHGMHAGDALRPFLLHAYGGMYLDLDVQCFASSEAWLAPYTLVLQSEYADGRDIVNSVMASVPGHPFWKAIIGQMMQVRGAAPVGNGCIVGASATPGMYYHLRNVTRLRC